ncbi:hypothetical protein R3P38DRAFT_2810508 [Favolaschia claudopus]|uniref:Maturase K n=1 Tax=Favolaschia claudopus TaxID=2862362 RepID=A0AAV9ZBD9_9AGAR
MLRFREHSARKPKLCSPRHPLGENYEASEERLELEDSNRAARSPKERFSESSREEESIHQMGKHEQIIGLETSLQFKRKLRAHLASFPTERERETTRCLCLFLRRMQCSQQLATRYTLSRISRSVLRRWYSKIPESLQLQDGDAFENLELGSNFSVRKSSLGFAWLYRLSTIVSFSSHNADTNWSSTGRCLRKHTRNSGWERHKPIESEQELG